MSTRYHSIEQHRTVDRWYSRTKEENNGVYRIELAKQKECAGGADNKETTRQNEKRNVCVLNNLQFVCASACGDDELHF